jgi:hypothetical protein
MTCAPSASSRARVAAPIPEAEPETAMTRMRRVCRADAAQSIRGPVRKRQGEAKG